MIAYQVRFNLVAQRIFLVDVAGARNGTVNQQRDNTGMCQYNGLFEKFAAIAKL